QWGRAPKNQSSRVKVRTGKEAGPFTLPTVSHVITAIRQKMAPSALPSRVHRLNWLNLEFYAHNILPDINPNEIRRSCPLSRSSKTRSLISSSTCVDKSPSQKTYRQKIHTSRHQKTSPSTP